MHLNTRGIKVGCPPDSGSYSSINRTPRIKLTMNNQPFHEDFPFRTILIKSRHLTLKFDFYIVVGAELNQAEVIILNR